MLTSGAVFCLLASTQVLLFTARYELDWRGPYRRNRSSRCVRPTRQSVLIIRDILDTAVKPPAPAPLCRCASYSACTPIPSYPHPLSPFRRRARTVTTPGLPWPLAPPSSMRSFRRPSRRSRSRRSSSPARSTSRRWPAHQPRFRTLTPFRSLPRCVSPPSAYVQDPRGRTSNASRVGLAFCCLCMYFRHSRLSRHEAPPFPPSNS